MPGPTRPNSVRGLMVIIAALAVVFALLARFVSYGYQTREAARRSQCISHLKWIGVGLLNYHETYGAFPPAYVADSKGRPLYSWRVLLAAYLEQSSGSTPKLGPGFRFDEAWDSPSNQRFHSLRPNCLYCPSHPEHAADDLTNYVVVVGPDTLFPSDGSSRTLADVRDGDERTLMIVECDNVPIHWMEPRELDWDTMSLRINDPKRPGLSSPHGYDGVGKPNVATVGTRIGWVGTGVPPAALRALLTIRGGEPIEPSESLSSLHLDD